MTDIDIAAIRQREQAATEGPWKTGDRFGNRSLGSSVVVLAGNLPPARLDPHRNGRNDAVFIAAARTDVPALLAKVDELTAELERMREGRRGLVGKIRELTAALTEHDAELTAANRRADGLEADLRSAVKGNTAWANQTGEQQYLIWSHKQLAWWGPGGAGYRWDISRAGRFSLDRANDHASTRSWPADRKTPPEVVIPAPPVDVLSDPGRIDGWIDEQVKAATDAKIAARKAEKAEVAR